MTVKELIDVLQNIEDKELIVYVYSMERADRFPINMVDDTLTDCVDINIDDEIK